MIPKHVEGKSAEQIMREVRSVFIFRNRHTPESLSIEGYSDYLDELLKLAIQDALLNAEEVKELIQEGEYKAQQRAIVFLNTILPEK